MLAERRTIAAAAGWPYLAFERVDVIDDCSIVDEAPTPSDPERGRAWRSTSSHPQPHIWPPGSSLSIGGCHVLLSLVVAASLQPLASCPSGLHQCSSNSLFPKPSEVGGSRTMGWWWWRGSLPSHHIRCRFAVIRPNPWKPKFRSPKAACAGTKLEGSLGADCPALEPPSRGLPTVLPSSKTIRDSPCKERKRGVDDTRCAGTG
jgi:hypothetical protein